MTAREGADMGYHLAMRLLVATSLAVAVAGCGQRRVLSKAQNLYAAGRYEEAVTVFSSLADGKGKVAEQAQLYLGFSNFKMARHQEAIRQFELLPERFPESELADDAQYWIGRCFEDWGKPREALAAYRKALETIPPSGKANMALRAREAMDMLEEQTSVRGEEG
jgi:TolA-binding protein